MMISSQLVMHPPQRENHIYPHLPTFHSQIKVKQMELFRPGTIKPPGVMFDRHGRGLITWAELADVAKAIGFPMLIREDILVAAGQPEDALPKTSVGLEYEELKTLLEAPAMAEQLDYSANKHNALYNSKVIKKAISLLARGHVRS